MSWFFSEDHTLPVIGAEAQIRSKYPETGIVPLPPRAVVFCLGKGLPVLEENFATHLILEQLPGFITHSRVLGMKGFPEVCFLHGGYGGPQIACAVETLRVLGVKELFLVGLCGGFGEDTQVGDVLVPERVWSEEGVSRHYIETPGFAKVNSPAPLEELVSFFQKQGFRAALKNTVTTDAVYRQTYYKEALWREMGCHGVDMEASAFVNLCNYYGLKSSVALMVSDRHPLHQGDPPWGWGGLDFQELRDRFIVACIKYGIA